MNIIAVVVTYNRLESLKRVLESLKVQTKKVSEIVVINNSSTDGTEVFLKSCEQLTVVKQKNIGGAGGFKTGVNYAFNKNADWIWMMDDDVYPEADCLEKMLLYSPVSECIHPTRYYMDDVKVIWNSHYSLLFDKKIIIDNIMIQNKEFFYSNSGCFEGMLINRNIVRQIGFPDARFFIAGDDVIYGYLANLYTNVITVNSAVMIRDMKSTDRMLRPMYLYYTIRNRHLFEEYYKKLFDKTSIPRVYKYNFIKFLIITLVSIVVRKKYNLRLKMDLINSIFKGIRDYRKTLVGKTF